MQYFCCSSSNILRYWPSKVIETITVLTKTHDLFIYTEVWLPLKRKLSFFDDFTLNWMLLLLIFQYFDIFIWFHLLFSFSYKPSLFIKISMETSLFRLLRVMHECILKENICFQWLDSYSYILADKTEKMDMAVNFTEFFILLRD